MQKPHQPANRDDTHLLTNTDLTVDLISGNTVTAIGTDNHEILRLDDNIIDEVVINTYVDLTKSSNQILLNKEVPIEIGSTQDETRTVHKPKITEPKKASKKRVKSDHSPSEIRTYNEKDSDKISEFEHGAPKRHTCPQCLHVLGSATRCVSSSCKIK